MNDIPVVKISGPAALATSIPYLVGFQPVESIVLVFMHDRDGRNGVGPTVRFDLVDPEASFTELLAESVVMVLKGAPSHGIDLSMKVAIVAYSATDQAEKIKEAETLLGLVGFDALESFRVHDFHAWFDTGDHEKCSHLNPEPIDTPVDEAFLKAGVDYAPTREQWAAAKTEA